ncbi:hypothetical protein OAD04_02430 [Schleiferiaceae bacterium]|nr:hypothetical protein [Schleiferiaceae bacterium]
MISEFKAALSSSEKQRKLMLMNSDLENLLKEKIVNYGLDKEGITQQ